MKSFKFSDLIFLSFICVPCLLQENPVQEAKKQNHFIRPSWSENRSNKITFPLPLLVLCSAVRLSSTSWASFGHVGVRLTLHGWVPNWVWVQECMCGCQPLHPLWSGQQLFYSLQKASKGDPQPWPYDCHHMGQVSGRLAGSTVTSATCPGETDELHFWLWAAARWPARNPLGRPLSSWMGER